MTAARHQPTISCDPLRQFGRPCITGTRITAETIAGSVWAGDSVDSVADNYGVDRLDVLWCCAWWIAEGGLHGTRGQRRQRWMLWYEHAMRVLGGWDKRRRRLCDPDDYA